MMSKNLFNKQFYYLFILFILLLTINKCLCRNNEYIFDLDDNNNNNNDDTDNANSINNNNNIFLNNSFNLNDNDINYNFINNNKNINNNDTNIELHRCDPSNVDFNCTVEEFLKFARGPQTLPLSTALLVTILFVGIFVTGVVGNVIVCVVIVRHSTMHTATNYYLFSLAVSDLIFLMMGLPYELSLYWHQYPYNLGLGFCKIRALISEASTYVSVLTIVAFSMERFLAICHPLHLYTMSGFKRAVRIIAVLWIVSFLSAVPFAVFTTIDYISYPPDNSTIPDSAFCAMLENPNDFPLWELSTCVFFAVPMALIMVLYGRMGMRIRSRTRHTLALGVQQGSIHGESRQSQSRKAIIRMLAAVVITFFVCWAPFHAQRLMFLYARNWAHYQDLNTWLFSVAGWLYYVSCTINPILYNVMSHRYRVAFKETLCGKKRNGFQNNGFARDQSSFRETTIAGSGSYENSQLIRVRSVIAAKRYSRYKDRERLTGGSTTTSTLPNSPNKVNEPISTAITATTPTTNGAIQQTPTILTMPPAPGIIVKTNSINISVNGNNCAVSIGTGGNLNSGGSGNSIKWKDRILTKNESIEDEIPQKNASIQQPTSAQTTTTTTTSIAQTVQQQSQPVTTDMVVILGNPLNGRPKCYPTTINHLTNNKHKNIDKDLFGEKNKNETCI